MSKTPPNPEKVSFYASQPHDCNYLPDRQATTVFADPEFSNHSSLYTILSEYGFRRSGQYIYRPECDDCDACKAIRIPVQSFKMNRIQRRNWRQNQDLTINKVPAEFNEEHFALYERYIYQRHSGGGMDNPSRQSYMEFLTSDWADTTFYEFRLSHKLVSIAVVDQMANALSAVYTFFDSKFNHRSPGRFAILYQIQQAIAMSKEWLYLGYWIESCDKMSYKQEYRPQLYFSKGKWSDINHTKPLPKGKN